MEAMRLGMSLNAGGCPVVCYLNLGLTGAAQRTASVLGYNYPGSSWYQSAYNALKAHHLLAPPPVAGADQSGAAAPDQSGADTGASATTPPADTTQSAAPAAKKHRWYWPF